MLYVKFCFSQDNDACDADPFTTDSMKKMVEKFESASEKHDVENLDFDVKTINESLFVMLDKFDWDRPQVGCCHVLF